MKRELRYHADILTRLALVPFVMYVVIGKIIVFVAGVIPIRVVDYWRRRFGGTR